MIEELAQLKQWCCWRRTDGDGKMPVTVTGDTFRSNDPSTFGTYEQAVASRDDIGFVIQEDDPYVGIDLDNCLDDGGNLCEWALPIVAKLVNVGYGEISPSGRGIKFLVRGKKRDGATCRYEFGGDKEQIECYEKNRFWTMTEDHYAGSMLQLDQDGQAVIDWICDKYLAKDTKPVTPATTSPTPIVSPVGYAGGNLLRRAQAYAASCQLPDVGGRNGACFSLAGNLASLRGDDGEQLTVEQITQIVEHWARSQGATPSREDEIPKAVASAFRTGTPRETKEATRLPEIDPDVDLTGIMNQRVVTEGNMTYAVQENRVGPSQTEPTQIETPHQRQRRILTGYESNASQSQMYVPTEEEIGAIGERFGTSFKVYDPAEFDKADFTVKFLIDQALVEGQPAVIAGPSKALKTSVSIAMAVALASGRPFLGQYEVTEPQTVLFLSAESGMATIKSCLGRICYSLRIEPKSLPIHFGDWVPHAKIEEKLAVARYWINRIRPGVAFLDPVYQSVDGADAANLALMGEQLTTLSRLALHFEATPVLVHHTKKTTPAVLERQPLEIHDLAGAGVTEHFRQWILLNRRAKFRPGEPHKLWLSCGGSAGHASEWAVDIDEQRENGGMPRGWSISIRDAHEAEAEQASARDRKKELAEQAKTASGVTKIERLFRKDEKPRTRSQIRDNCGCTGSPFNQAFSELLMTDVLIMQMRKAANNREHEHFTFDFVTYADRYAANPANNGTTE